MSIHDDENFRLKYESLEKQFEEYKNVKEKEVTALRTELERTKEDLSDITQIKLDKLLKNQQIYQSELLLYLLPTLDSPHAQMCDDFLRSSSTKKRKATTWRRTPLVHLNASRLSFWICFSPRYFCALASMNFAVTYFVVEEIKCWLLSCRLKIEVNEWTCSSNDVRAVELNLVVTGQIIPEETSERARKSSWLTVMNRRWNDVIECGDSHTDEITLCNDIKDVVRKRTE